MVKPASKYLSEEERRSVEEAIAAAEKKTSGELVVVLATRSGRYDRAEDLFGLLTGCLAVASAWHFLQGTQYQASEWRSGWELTLGLLPVLGLFLGGFAVGAFAATRVPYLGRLFVTRKQLFEEIRQKAAQAFHDFRVRKTAEGTGILIFVSLFEHMVWVVGDDAINEKFDQTSWNEIRDRILEGFRKGDPAAGLRAGVQRCGEILSEHLPVEEGDVDELPNTVRFLD